NAQASVEQHRRIFRARGRGRARLRADDRRAGPRGDDDHAAGRCRDRVDRSRAVRGRNLRSAGRAMRTTMLDRQKVEAILGRRFPGSTPDTIAAAANAIMGLRDEWEEVLHEDEQFGYHYSNR